MDQLPSRTARDLNARAGPAAGAAMSPKSTRIDGSPEAGPSQRHDQAQIHPTRIKPGRSDSLSTSTSTPRPTVLALSNLIHMDPSGSGRSDGLQGVSVTAKNPSTLKRSRSSSPMIGMTGGPDRAGISKGNQSVPEPPISPISLQPVYNATRVEQSLQVPDAHAQK
jgi:hypothetical protein